MENKKLLKFITNLFILALLVSFLFLPKAQSYDAKCSHPKLTENIAQIYNQYVEPDLTPEQIAWLKWGAEHEDTPPRYLNHFYDPINNMGWANQLTANQWAQDSVKQSLPGFFGDYSWPKAIYEYQQGNQEYAYKALGHILHLAQDVSVPAHTRDDTHLPFESTESPYENWVEKYCATNNFNFSGQIIIYDNLNAYFDNLALYSNNYFYSADSIGQYEKPIITHEDSQYVYGLDDENKQFRLAEKVAAYLRNFTQISPYQLSDEVISDYFQRLGPKAAQYGAGVVYLFHQTVAQQKVEKPASIWSIIKNFVIEIFQTGPKKAMISQSLMPEIAEPESVFVQESNNQETISDNQTITNLPITNNQTSELKQEIKPATKTTRSQPKIQKSEPRPETETEIVFQPKTQQAPAFFPIGGPAPIPEPEPEPEPKEEPEPEPEDTIPPTISHNINTQIEWHTQDINIILLAKDDLDQNPVIFYRLSNGQRQTGSNFTISENGTHLLEFYSQDQAGNQEETQSLTIKIDKTAPSSAINALETETENTQILLSWSGADNENGSGILDYDISYKQDSQDWQMVLENATSTQTTFQTECCHAYYFRSRSRDQAGNLEDWPETHDTKINIVDNTAPSKPILTSPQAENNFILTNASTTQLIGTCSQDTGIILINSTMVTPIAQEWSYNLSLENATTSLQIIAQDQAGNSSEALELVIGYDYVSPGLIVVSNFNEKAITLFAWLDNLGPGFISPLKKIEFQYKKNASSSLENIQWQTFFAANEFEIEIFMYEELLLEQGYFYDFRIIAEDEANNQTIHSEDPWQIYFPQVLINEIAWMGTKASSSDEWIELYNFGDYQIEANDLTLFGLMVSGGYKTITIEKPIPAHSYYLLERTDDTTIKNISADQIYAGYLKDDGYAFLKLNYKNGLSVDEAETINSQWPAGNKTERRSMERAGSNWQTYQGQGSGAALDAKSWAILGTPRAENSQ